MTDPLPFDLWKYEIVAQDETVRLMMGMVARVFAALAPPWVRPRPGALRSRWSYLMGARRPWAALSAIYVHDLDYWSPGHISAGAASAGRVDTLRGLNGSIFHGRNFVNEAYKAALRCRQWPVIDWYLEGDGEVALYDFETAVIHGDSAFLDGLAERYQRSADLNLDVPLEEKYPVPTRGDVLLLAAARAGALASLDWLERKGAVLSDRLWVDAFSAAAGAGSIECLEWFRTRSDNPARDMGSVLSAPTECTHAFAEYYVSLCGIGRLADLVRGRASEKTLVWIDWLCRRDAAAADRLADYARTRTPFSSLNAERLAIALVVARAVPQDSPIFAKLAPLLPPTVRKPITATEPVSPEPGWVWRFNEGRDLLAGLRGRPFS